MPHTAQHYLVSNNEVEVAIPKPGDFLRANSIGRWASLPSVSTLLDPAITQLDASLGWLFLLTATGNRTIAVPTNSISGQRIIIIHTASGAGRTLTLSNAPGGFRFGSDITELTITASGKTDYIGAIYNEAANFWDVVAVSKGY